MGSARLVSLLVVVTRAANVGMNDRRAVRGPRGCSASIELVVEDGANRAVSERADLDGARGGSLQTCDTECPGQAENAEAGSEALLGMRSALQDKIAQCRCCRPDQCGISPNPADRPVGVPAVTGRHVIGDGGMLAVAASSHVRGDPFALDEDLYGAAGEPHLDFAAREAIRHAVEVVLNLNVVIDTDTTH